MKEPSQADLVRKRLMDIRMRMYASPSYLEAHGTPETMSDLQNHRVICQNANSFQVNAGAQLIRQLQEEGVENFLTVNNYFGVLQGVIYDLGVGVLPDYLTRDFPDLVPVVPTALSREVPVFLAYPEELRHSRRVEVFRDFVQEEVIAYRKLKRAAESSNVA